MINLSDLLLGTPNILSTSSQVPNTLSITGITTDPHLCRPGCLYIAAESETVDSKRYGVRLDGRDYIDLAIQNGAAAVLTTPDVTPRPEAIFIFHQTPLAQIGTLCQRFFGAPYPKHIALVTGTNGKTSVVNFCRMLWTLANLPCCSIGNLGGVCNDGSVVWERDPTLSVPETITLHQILTSLKTKNIDHVACEATSHALFDHRLTGVPAHIGAFMNLTRDHLDFHHTMEKYFEVKMSLFEEVLPSGSWAILNADDDWYPKTLSRCQKRGHKIISFGFKGKEIRLIDCVTQKTGQDLTIEINGQRYQTHLNLFGLFQVSNVLCSLGIVIAAGMPADTALKLIPLLTEVEGRLNTVGFTPAGGQVIVDYGHTPDGIRAALEACRSFTTGKLFIVFGCSGGRDKGKRKPMGEVASTLADQVIITDAHPRHEDPAQIRRDILEGAPNALEVPDRAQAIETACEKLRQGDTLIITGFGHVKFQWIGDELRPYSDMETAKKIIDGL